MGEQDNVIKVDFGHNPQPNPVLERAVFFIDAALEGFALADVSEEGKMAFVEKQLKDFSPEEQAEIRRRVGIETVEVHDITRKEDNGEDI